jgi:mRNA-degrading endonuclease toxin of MazEF toxin-antitoxin module
MRKYKWHIFLATLDPVVGSEQGKTRPVLIISDEEINQILPVVNALPITSHLRHIQTNIHIGRAPYVKKSVPNYLTPIDFKNSFFTI